MDNQNILEKYKNLVGHTKKLENELEMATDFNEMIVSNEKKLKKENVVLNHRVEILTDNLKKAEEDIDFLEEKNKEAEYRLSNIEKTITDEGNELSLNLNDVMKNRIDAYNAQRELSEEQINELRQMALQMTPIRKRRYN